MPAPPLASLIQGRGKYLRPTRIVGGASGGQNLGVGVLGLRDLERIPEQLRTTYEVMIRKLQAELQAAARSVVPGGPTGKLGLQVHARLIRTGGTNRIIVGTVGSEFARALDRGFTATPKRGKAMRFNTSDDLVFTKRVRVAGRHFYAKWVAMAGPIVEARYEASFYNIRDLY